MKWTLTFNGLGAELYCMINYFLGEKNYEGVKNINEKK
jgi:hypothetical protein